MAPYGDNVGTLCWSSAHALLICDQARLHHHALCGLGLGPAPQARLRLLLLLPRLLLRLRLVVGLPLVGLQLLLLLLLELRLVVGLPLVAGLLRRLRLLPLLLLLRLLRLLPPSPRCAHAPAAGRPQGGPLRSSPSPASSQRTGAGRRERFGATWADSQHADQDPYGFVRLLEVMLRTPMGLYGP